MQDLAAKCDVRCRNRNKLRAKEGYHVIGAYPVLSVFTLRAELGRDGESTRMGVRAALALTGLSFRVASVHTPSHLFSVTLIVAHHVTRTHI